MSIDRCLDEKVAAGKLSKALADEAKANIRRLERRYRREMGQGAGEPAAAAETARIMAEVAARRKRQKGLKVIAMDRALTVIDDHEKGAAAGLMALLTRDIFERSDAVPVETLAEIIRGDLAREFDIGLSAYRSRLAGLSQDQVGIRNFVRELYGEGTGDAVAANAAQAWVRATDKAAKRYAAVGGEIFERDDWRLGQRHDADRIRVEGFATWSAVMRDAFHRGDLDVLDFKTGERVTSEEFETLVRQAFDHIVSRVQAKRLGDIQGNRALPRMFHWKTAEAWLAYNDRFGTGKGGIFDLLTGHLDRMARDIALTSQLGPGHRANMEALVDHVIEQESATPSRALSRLSPARWVNSPRLAFNTYRYLNGELSIPSNEVIAGAASGLRGWLTGLQLGSATLTAIPGDSATTLIASLNTGIPAARVIQRAAQLIANDRGSKALATRMGIIAYAISDTALGTKRFGDELLGQNFGGRVADTVIRASGLAHWTNAMKQAFMLEFSGLIASQAGRRYANINKDLRRAFKRYGISEAEWDEIRASDLIEGPDGATFFDPVAMENQGLAEKVMSMIVQERAYAVVEPDARVRAFLTQGTERGTLEGEFMRSTAMYKSFSTTILLTTLTRAMFRTPERGGLGSMGTRLAAFAGLQLLLTFAGAMAIQMRQIATGKDPRDMTTEDFWGSAFITGGGSGFLGDYIYNGYARGDRGLITGLIGPVAGLVEDTARLSMSNIRQAIEGRDTKFGTELARFLRFNAFPGSNIWYLRAILDRTVMDQVQLMVDPDYAESLRRMEERARKAFGQEFWWRPGQALPERGPNTGAVLGP